MWSCLCRIVGDDVDESKPVGARPCVNCIAECAWVGLVCCFLLVAPILGLNAGSALAQAQQEASPSLTPKRILFLHSFGYGLPAYEKATPAFLSVMKAASVSTDDLFFEYLDLLRNKDKEHRRHLIDLFRHEYAGRKIDLIITVHSPAIGFLLEEGKEIFPEVPVISLLAPETIETGTSGRLFVHMPISLDIRGTLERALELFPETRRVVFVSGYPELDRRFEREARTSFAPWHDKLEFEYTGDLSLEEMLQRVASLPPRSVVIYANFFADRTGRTFVPRDVGAMVARDAGAPVFGLYDTLVGTGIVGGSMLSFEAEGARAGKLALDILSGKLSLTQRVTTLASGRTPIFDWQQIKKWEGNPGNLPAESKLLNYEPSLWDRYRHYVLGIICLSALQLFMIISLLIQKRRRRTAEDALRQSEEKYRGIFENAVEGIFQSTPEGRFVSANPACARILGYESSHEMLRDIVRIDEQIYPNPQDRARLKEMLEETGIVKDFQVRVRRKDGSEAWVSANVIAVRDPGGSILYYEGTIEDITQRKLAEEELQRHRDYLDELVKERTADLEDTKRRIELLLEAMGEGIYGLDLDGKCTFINPAAAKMIDREIHDLVGRTLHTILHHTKPDGSPYPVEECPIYLAFKDGTKRGVSDEVFWRRDGTCFPVEYVSTPIEENGSLVGSVVVFRDITRRKRAEQVVEQAREAAEAASRAKSNFLAHMSHELRTPLSAIISYSQLMARDRHLTVKQKDQLAAIGRNSDYLLDMINDVLEMSKIEAGRMILDEDNVDICGLLCAMENMFGVRAHTKGLELTFETSPQLPGHVRTDQRKLRQIIVNLLGNAIKFTEQGRVTVRTQYLAGQLRLDVEDTGPGIDPDAMDWIFQPFRQTDLGRSAQQGTGLGLAISRSIAQAMGGRIDAQSIVGKGSRFGIEVPAPAVDRSSEGKPVLPRLPAGLEPGQPARRILVAEDHSDTRYALKGILESVGFTVSTASNGQEAVQQFTIHKPHLIWMDIRMPLMDGVEAARRIRETEEGRDTKIIALTAHVFEEDRKNIFAAGFDGFVRKPFSEVEIFDILKTHLDVSYVYAEEPRSQPIGIAAAPEKDVLGTIPYNTLCDLREAVRRLDPAACTRVIGRIAFHNPVLAGYIENLVDGFRFDLLNDLLGEEPP